jgi:peroxiredoxin
VELELSYQALQEAGAEAVAIVVAPLTTVENWCRSYGFHYPLLADSDHQVSAAYGVYNLFGNGLAGPAVFVIAPDRAVLWSYVGSAPIDPVSGDTILAQLPQ